MLSTTMVSFDLTNNLQYSTLCLLSSGIWFYSIRFTKCSLSRITNNQEICLLQFTKHHYFKKEFVSVKHIHVIVHSPFVAIECGNLAPNAPVPGPAFYSRDVYGKHKEL